MLTENLLKNSSWVHVNYWALTHVFVLLNPKKKRYIAYVVDNNIDRSYTNLRPAVKNAEKNLGNWGIFKKIPKFENYTITTLQNFKYEISYIDRPKQNILWKDNSRDRVEHLRTKFVIDCENDRSVADIF